MSARILKSLFLPGGIILLCAFLLFATGLLRLSVSALGVYYYATFIAGILLAWRFHSSRILFAMITILLACRAMQFFSSGGSVFTGPGRIAFEAVAVLIPLNFIFIAFSQERGLALSRIAPHIALLFFESVFVAVICRPGETVAPGIIHDSILGRSANSLPQMGVVLFVIAFAALLTKFFLHHKPVESGLFWSATAALLGLYAGAPGRNGTAYFATAGLVLASSIIENTYALAFHDELTGLPSRRSFNETMQSLVAPYSIAVVDIDHFKTFNDTYGHDTGDEVLRLVAGRLAAVGGGGRAYRVGGEEFSIVFSGKSWKETLEPLETLRTTIQDSTFRLRSAPERRAEPRGPDRRNVGRPGATSKKPAARKLRERNDEGELSVTVSIGVADSSEKNRNPEQVMNQADKALYRAKRAGRNRVEAHRAGRSRSPRTAGRTIAS